MALPVGSRQVSPSREGSSSRGDSDSRSSSPEYYSSSIPSSEGSSSHKSSSSPPGLSRPSVSAFQQRSESPSGSGSGSASAYGSASPRDPASPNESSYKAGSPSEQGTSTQGEFTAESHSVHSIDSASPSPVEPAPSGHWPGDFSKVLNRMYWVAEKLEENPDYDLNIEYIKRHFLEPVLAEGRRIQQPRFGNNKESNTELSPEQDPKGLRDYIKKMASACESKVKALEDELDKERKHNAEMKHALEAAHKKSFAHEVESKRWKSTARTNEALHTKKMKDMEEVHAEALKKYAEQVNALKEANQKVSHYAIKQRQKRAWNDGYNFNKLEHKLVEERIQRGLQIGNLRNRLKSETLANLLELQEQSEHASALQAEVNQLKEDNDYLMRVINADRVRRAEALRASLDNEESAEETESSSSSEAPSSPSSLPAPTPTPVAPSTAVPSGSKRKALARQPASGARGQGSMGPPPKRSRRQ